MILGTKARYAVTAMVYLAAKGEGRAVNLAEVAGDQEISLAYLEQIFNKLKKQALVTSVRGPGGGYRLARGAGEIRISDIVLAVDEPIKMTRCNSHKNSGCLARSARCLTHDLWDGLGNQIHAYLHSLTLEEVGKGRVAHD